MAISLDDRTLEQLEKDAKPDFQPIPAGTICDFEVLREGKAYGKTVYTEETTSKTNKPMLVAVLEVFYESKPRTIVVYLTDGDSNYEKWKNKSFAVCLGINELSANQAIGRSGRLVVDVEESEYNGKTSEKNTVKEFLKGGVAVDVELDDEIPF
jgi:hypothetical protein